jgi:hypothetical protein
MTRHTRQNVNHPPDRKAIRAVCPHPAYNAWIRRTTVPATASSRFYEGRVRKSLTALFELGCLACEGRALHQCPAL